LLGLADLSAPACDKFHRMKSLLFLAALVVAVPAKAQSAIDGDTIRIGASTFRLWGIDAPEGMQACHGALAGSL
jgi:endonuclease YncB( thermonuclease family)